MAANIFNSIGGSSEPKLTSSLEDFVIAGEGSTVNYHSFSLLENVGEYKFPIFNVLDDYQEELEAISTEYELTDAWVKRYAYRPRLLAYELYGDGELYFILLMINGMASIKEFNLSNKKIKYPSKERLTEFLKQVFKSEKKQIDSYNEK